MKNTDLSTLDKDSIDDGNISQKKPNKTTLYKAVAIIILVLFIGILIKYTHVFDNGLSVIGLAKKPCIITSDNAIQILNSADKYINKECTITGDIISIYDDNMFSMEAEKIPFPVEIIYNTTAVREGSSVEVTGKIKGKRIVMGTETLIIEASNIKFVPIMVKAKDVRPVIQAYLNMLKEVTGVLDPWDNSHWDYDYEPNVLLYDEFFDDAHKRFQCLHEDYRYEEAGFWRKNYHKFENIKGNSFISENELIIIEEIIPDDEGSIAVSTLERWEVCVGPFRYEEVISRTYTLKRDGDRKLKIVRTNKDDFFRLVEKDIDWEITASSTLKPEGTLRYDPWLVDDYDPDTAWVEGKSDEGIGEWIMFNLPDKTYCNIKWISILNGYQSSEELYYANNRVKRFRLDISGKEGEKSYKCSLDDHTFGIEANCHFRDGVIGDVNSFKITILEVYRGNKYNDTCIAGIYPHL